MPSAVSPLITRTGTVRVITRTWECPLTRRAGTCVLQTISWPASIAAMARNSTTSKSSSAAKWSRVSHIYIYIYIYQTELQLNWCKLKLKENANRRRNKRRFKSLVCFTVVVHKIRTLLKHLIKEARQTRWKSLLWTTASLRLFATWGDVGQSNEFLLKYGLNIGRH